MQKISTRFLVFDPGSLRVVDWRWDLDAATELAVQWGERAGVRAQVLEIISRGGEVIDADMAPGPEWCEAGCAAEGDPYCNDCERDHQRREETERSLDAALNYRRC